MEEIKANEILRTADGKLYKIVSATKDDFLCLQMRENSTIVELLSDLNSIIKHSSNIIDIIECGDYVNGYKVSFIAQDCAKFVQCDYPVETGTTNHYKFYKESIKDVVTKEQFEQMKYIVGDESNVKD